MAVEFNYRFGSTDLMRSPQNALGNGQSRRFFTVNSVLEKGSQMILLLQDQKPACAQVIQFHGLSSARSQSNSETVCVEKEKGAVETIFSILSPKIRFEKCFQDAPNSITVKITSLR
jgi:hypothetical protein